MTQTKYMTLCMVTSGSRILLGMKKRGFGQGRWNGFGGKVEEGEPLEEAAEREFIEETGLEPKFTLPRAVLRFRFQDDPVELEVHLFEVGIGNEEPIETEEMRPQWFDLDKIPYEQMWPDDKLWLPLFLQGKNFKGEFLFADPNTLLDYKITETKKQVA